MLKKMLPILRYDQLLRTGSYQARSVLSPFKAEMMDRHTQTHTHERGEILSNTNHPVTRDKWLPFLTFYISVSPTHR